MLKVNGAWYLEALPRYIIVEREDNTLGMFRRSPTVEIKEKDISPYKGQHPKNATPQYPVPEYIYLLYGLEKVDQKERLSELIRVRVSPAQEQKIEDYANKNNSNVSQVIRDFIDSLDI